MEAQITQTCRVVRAGEVYEGKQGLDYTPAISAETVGARCINMQLVTIPPHGRARAHQHHGHETAAYVISGEVQLWFGDMLEQHELAGPGDFLFIPAGVPHLPVNPSANISAQVIIARTDPNDNENVTLLPELDGRAQ